MRETRIGRPLGGRPALPLTLVVALAVMRAHGESPTSANASSDARLDEIEVTAQRRAAEDARIGRSVEAAMAADPYFYDGHITITVADGIATLHGIVFDDWDLRQAMRIARRIRGVRRVVNDLEIQVGGD